MGHHLTAMDLNNIKNNNIKIKISANNGETVIKDDSINIGSFADSPNDSSQKSQESVSYLSALSSSLKCMKQETNSILTEFINKTANGKNSVDKKDTEAPEEDESDSDDAIG